MNTGIVLGKLALGEEITVVIIPHQADAHLQQDSSCAFASALGHTFSPKPKEKSCSSGS